jgi:hypothetical protein
LFNSSNYEDLEIFVNVWDCQATLQIGREEPKGAGKYTYRSEDEFTLTEAQREQLEKLKNQVIYKDNSGAINWSGRYYPSPSTLKKIVKLLEGQL